MLRFTRFVYVVFLFLLPLRSAFAQSSEVTLGAQAWSFDRVYPLLDGLFQDAASTQVANLTLNPNLANGTQLDAVVQSFQVQAGYNQLSSMQNNVATQMAAANLGYQSVVAQQSQSILQQQLAAQQQLASAQQTYANAQQSGNTAGATAASQQITAAQALITNLATEMTLVKANAPASPWSPSAASTALAPSVPMSVTSSVPSSVLGTGTNSSGPSFPATKQLDNQMDLLWARLARVVGAMTRPDSVRPDDRLYLLEFDTGTFPNSEERGKLLETRYHLSCTDLHKGTPTLLDMFPRVAAVNIAETNYRDNNVGIGAVLAFLGIGINASYNREHLQLSQVLGQSSYITGYGVGQQDFGWRFGIPLGGKILSSDTKRTFALIRVPSDCEKPLVHLAGTAWNKPKAALVASMTSDQNKIAQQSAFLVDVDHVMDVSTPAARPAPTVQRLLGLDFNRVSYDPTKYSTANPAVVTLAVKLSQPLDQQAIVYANGQLVKRVRDTFGRAIPTGNGSNGALESGSITSANTWMPTSSKSLLVNLDGGQFGESFPTIRIVSPTDTYTLAASDLVKNPVDVSGVQYQCVASTCQLPSLAYRQLTAAHVGVARWTAGTTTKVVFTVTDAAATPATPSSNAGASVQLVTSNVHQVWGSNVEVYVTYPSDDQTKTYRLSCDPTISSAERLICGIDFTAFNAAHTDHKLDNTDEAHFHILDPGHVGGPIEAWTVLGEGGDDSISPIVWDVTDPLWDDSQQGWTFHVDFANVAQNATLTLSSPRMSHVANFTCNADHICSAPFVILQTEVEQWFDRMKVSISGKNDYQATLSNLKSLISPVATSINDDFTSWSGTNLTPVYTNLKIGKAGSPVSINCVFVSCVLADGAVLPKTSGYMYLSGNGMQELLAQQNSDGSTSPLTYKYKAPATQPPASQTVDQRNSSQQQPQTAPPAAAQPGGAVPPSPPQPTQQQQTPPPATQKLVLQGGPTGSS